MRLVVCAVVEPQALSASPKPSFDFKTELGNLIIFPQHTFLPKKGSKGVARPTQTSYTPLEAPLFPHEQEERKKPKL